MVPASTGGTEQKDPGWVFLVLALLQLLFYQSHHSVLGYGSSGYAVAQPRFQPSIRWGRCQMSTGHTRTRTYTCCATHFTSLVVLVRTRLAIPAFSAAPNAVRMGALLSFRRRLLSTVVTAWVMCVRFLRWRGLQAGPWGRRLVCLGMLRWIENLWVGICRELLGNHGCGYVGPFWLLLLVCPSVGAVATGSR